MKIWNVAVTKPNSLGFFDMGIKIQYTSLVPKDVTLITAIQSIISNDITSKNCELFLGYFEKSISKIRNNKFWKDF